MSGIPGIPQNVQVQSGNQQILISWALSTGADSYLIQRSLDNVTYTPLTTISGTPLAIQYLDTGVTLGTTYFYQVAASNTSGISTYTNAMSAVPVPTGEMCLSQIILAAKQRADRVNSNFVTDSEWRQYVNQSMFELYDILITTFEDYYLAPPIQFVADGVTYQYPLPNGSNSFLDANNPAISLVPKPFYKLMGVDLALNNATNAYVTINKFNFIDRNRFVYPNTASTLYGVFNLQYRVLGSNIEFIPTPTAGQSIRLWYIPRITELLLDTDITTTGVSGWNEYIIVKAAYYALTKEESDTASLVMQLQALNTRIEQTAANRDAGQPDTISDTRSNRGSGYGGTQGGWGGGTAGWALALVPNLATHNETHNLLTNAIFFGQSGLTYTIIGIGIFYLLYKYGCQFSSGVSTTKCLSTFFRHILHVVFVRSKKKMIGSNAKLIVTRVTNKQAYGNLIIRQFIRESMRKICFPFMFKFSITPTSNTSTPQFTQSWTSGFNFIKKAFHISKFNTRDVA